MLNDSHDNAGDETNLHPPHAPEERKLTKQAVEEVPVIEYIRKVQVESSLKPSGQFWWGFLGGSLMVVYRTLIFANKLPNDASWPSATFKVCTICMIWALFPIISGLLSRVCDPHHRLIAVFEGASAPALFIFIAKDLPV